MHGKFWISSILAMAVSAALLPRASMAQPAPTPAPVPADATADPVQRWTSVLTDPQASPEGRSDAAKRLIAIRTPASRQAIVNILSDLRQPQAQVAIAQALADDPNPDRDPSFVNPLFVMLAGPGNSGLTAAKALGIYKNAGGTHDDILTRLIPIAQGVGGVRSEAGRRAAIIGLGQMPDESAADTLMQLLTSPNEASQVQAVAAEALGDLSGNSRIGFDPQGWRTWWADWTKDANGQAKTAQQFRDDLLAFKATQLSALERQNSDVESTFSDFLNNVYHATPLDQRVDKLKEYLTSSNAIMRAEGARIIYDDKTGGKPIPPNISDAQKLLEGMIGDIDPNVRLAAAQAMTVLSDPAATDLLIAQLRVEQDPNVRIMLAYALGQIGDIKAVDTLLQLTNDPREVVATAAAKALAAFGSQLQSIPRDTAQRAAKQLQIIYGRTAVNSPLRDGIMSAMAELRDDSLEPVFKTAVNNQNESPFVRINAIKGIKNLKDEKSADDIGNALKDADPGIRKAACDALPAVNGVSSSRKLVEMLQPNADNPDVQDKAWDALQSFLPSLDNADLQAFADQFDDKLPKYRASCLTQIRDNCMKAGDVDGLAWALQNLGSTLLNPDIADYDGAAAQFDNAISTLSSSGKYKPNSARMVPLYRDRLRATLRSGKYADAIDFAQQRAIKDGALDANDVGALIKDEADHLIKDGANNPPMLERAVKLIDESQRIDLPQVIRGNLNDDKVNAQQQIAREKGNGNAPSPVPPNLTFGATAKR